eukprot:scaffold2790_cov239-Pinguiococcus_pyrenoidosus.AAC.3
MALRRAQACRVARNQRSVEIPQTPKERLVELNEEDDAQKDRRHRCLRREGQGSALHALQLAGQLHN